MNGHATNGACPECAGIGVLEATDIFCGAGGSSLGLEHVSCPRCGRQLIKVTQALNHWDLAVQAHNANFPDADHDVHDVEVIPAKRFRRTPLLWASPDCTHHAYCRGPKDQGPDGERSRATFGDIVRFTAHHRYDAVIVENVVEARLWCDIRKHPAKCSCGGSFDDWYQAMIELGYEGRIVYFNSQFALPTPQSRDRMYVIFWRAGAQAPFLDFQPPSWCTGCEQIVHGVQTWKPASKGSSRERIPEWGRYGQQYLYTCPGCHAPVAPAVMGAKTIIDWSDPGERIGDRTYKNGATKDLAPKTRKRIKVGLERLQTTRPVAIQVGGNLFERKGYARVWSVDDPMRAVTGTNYTALVTPDCDSHNGNGHRADAVIVRYGGQSPAPTTIDEPMGTLTAHDRQRGVVVPNMTNNTPRLFEEPVPAVTGGNRNMLVQLNRGDKNGVVDESRTRDLDLPMPTVTGAHRGEHAIVSMRNHGDAKPTDMPAQSVCGGGYHHGLLVYNGNPGHVRDIEYEPAGVVKGRDSQALLMPYYGTGVTHDTKEPVGTLTTKDRQALVISEADIDDCLFRMLKWPELLRAQMMHALPGGGAYQLEARRRNNRGQMVELSNELRVKMIGNAVSSPVATMLGWSVVDALR
jgi:DNA (cytosine-5)-methyltransferase 1